MGTLGSVSGLFKPMQWLSNLLAGVSDDDEAKNITGDKAITYPPVWSCISKITGAFMIMPLNLHRQVDKMRSIQTQHNAYKLMRWRPNGYQTPSQWKRLMMCHALLWGNARSFIAKDDSGRPAELIPLMPDRCVTMLVDGQKKHAVLMERDDRISIYEEMGKDLRRVIFLDDSEVWHVPGLGFDGVNGKSLIQVAKQSWGLGLSDENKSYNQNKKGYAGGLMLEAPVGVFRNAADARQFLDDFREQHDGSDNAGKTALLREGIKASVQSMSNADAQFIEQRRFQREDTALLFCLEGILGDSSNSSYNSAEARALAYRVNCLAPWTNAFEEESELKLLNESERNRGFYFKFNDGALLRSEKDKTMAFISQGIACRVLNPNEGRDMLDMNPYPEGDDYANPAITPNQAGKNGSAGKDQVDSLAREQMIRDLITTEANNAIRAATAKNFVEWIDKNYAKWEPKLADKFEGIGLDRDLARIHCNESKDILLSVSGESTKENLQANIQLAVKDWPFRSNKILRAEEYVES